MILGMDAATFTIVHVMISLAGVAAGFVVLAEMLGQRAGRGWNATFLATTVATSVTGFFFPFTKLLPSHIVGFISLLFLAVAVFALYSRRLAGYWRPAYVVAAMTSLYLNVLVLVIQSFMKVPFLKALAPTQSEAPFIVVQGVVFVLLLLATAIAVARPARSSF